MITPCPHCQAEIEIDANTHATLAGQSHFACPACQGAVAVPARPKSPASVHRGINRNMLVLGTVALLVLGGIGVYLASQKSGDTQTTIQNIRNEILNNSYFTQLIASGVTTMKDLDAIAAIRPCRDGFIGVSAEPLDWMQAGELSGRTGSAILAPNSEPERDLVLWLTSTFPQETGNPLWMTKGGSPAVLVVPEVIAVAGSEGTRRVLLHWRSSSQLPDAAVASATKQKPFVNSLGMKFVPVPGTSVLFCIHETRRMDYAAYAKANPGTDRRWIGHNGYSIPAEEKPEHPVFYVSRNDAQAFCEWISRVEGRRYRLPTDKEWSHAVGIGDIEPPGTIESLQGHVRGRYPWGNVWPPPNSSGNYADADFATKYTNAKSIEGLRDGHIVTAPVMRFSPNEHGLYDLGGNVWEWCSDSWSQSSTDGVTRGASWRIAEENELLSSYRVRWTPSGSGISTGFRVVMELDNGESKVPPVPVTLGDPLNTTRRVIDLIQLAGQESASHAETWGVKGAELEFFKDGDVEFPYACGTREYDLEFEFSLLTEPVNSVSYSFPTIGGRCAFVMQLFRKFPKPFWGFGILDNVHYAFAKDARVLKDFPPLFTTGKRYQTIVKVREKALEGILDGKVLVHWEGDLSRFSSADKTLADPNHPKFGVYEGRALIHKATLIEFVPISP